MPRLIYNYNLCKLKNVEIALICFVNYLFSVTPLLLPVYFVYENLFFVLKRKDWVVSREVSYKSAHVLLNFKCGSRRGTGCPDHPPPPWKITRSQVIWVSIGNNRVQTSTGKPGKSQIKVPCMEKSWNLKTTEKSWKNHGIL